MTLQSSGAISLGNVQTEFGGSNPIGINEYYAAAAGVPGSDTISLYNFYGKSAVVPFSWTTAYIMGSVNGESGRGGSTSDSFAGNTVTPGSSFSPVTLTINSITDSGGSFSIYIGGSLTNTFLGAISTNHISTFGSSTYQFRSTVVDLSDDLSSKYTVVNVGATVVYAHYFSYNPDP